MGNQESQPEQGNASVPGLDSLAQNDFMNTFHHNGFGSSEKIEDQHEEEEDVNEEEQYNLRRPTLDVDAAKERELRELEKVDLVRGNNPGSALRRTTKKLSSMMTFQQITDLQRQEQQRAQDLQHRAIQKVLLEQNKSKSKQNKETQKLLNAISKAKETAFAVNEYKTHSKHLFSTHEQWVNRQTYA